MPAQAQSATALTGSIIDTKTGKLTWTGLQLFQQWQLLLSKGFNGSGVLISDIDPGVHIIGHPGTIGSIVQHIDEFGVVQSAGMVSATDAVQGAVVLPPGVTSNVLGSASTQSSGAFDPAGAASAAQTAAEAHADAVAATAQSNAETFAANASNLSSGVVPIGLLPGITVTVATAQLTTLGSGGSMIFENGLLVAQVPAT